MVDLLFDTRHSHRRGNNLRRLRKLKDCFHAPALVVRSRKVPKPLFFLALITFISGLTYTTNVVTNNPKEGTSFNAKAEKPFRLLVLYSYFEGDVSPQCEIRMKRTNLHTFLTYAVSETPHVTYVFTLSGRIPGVSEFYGSLGLPAPARRKLIPLFKNVKVFFSDVRAADLCHHAQSAAKIRLSSFKHILYMNDGVRGPFTLRPPFLTESGAFGNVPNWIEPYASLLYSEPYVGAVGTVLSHEISTHLQGWFVLLRKSDFQRFVVPLFMKTCGRMTWKDAINIEVQVTSSMLNAGKTLGGLFPEPKLVSRIDIIKGGKELNRPKGLTSEIKRLNKLLTENEKLYDEIKSSVLEKDMKLSQLSLVSKMMHDIADRRKRIASKHMNPLTRFALEYPNKQIPVLEILMLKIGGDFARHNVHSNATKSLVNLLTVEMFGKDTTNYWCFP